LVLTIESILLTGKKPPDDIMDIAILNESKVLRLINFKTINKIKVSDE
tara:strand:+ start:330 stop:473 length:144 start_codon:yes stop_codon:yes gene_type:complete